jgi:hypothetical protein
MAQKHPNDVVQTAITMPRHLKERYSKLAVRLDMSFSQLVRVSLGQLEECVNCRNSDSLKEFKQTSKSM